MAKDISNFAIIHSNVSVGHHCYIGGTENAKTVINKDCKIGAFSYIDKGVSLSEGVYVDNYCQVMKGSQIGFKTQILYRAQIYDNVRIGKKCIISGNVADRTIIGDYVTFMGIISHSYRNPGTYEDWDHGVPQPSPIIGSGSVIGELALIIGGITIGEDCYVAAGEIVRFSLPDRSVLYKGKVSKVEDWHGVILPRTRDKQEK